MQRGLSAVDLRAAFQDDSRIAKLARAAMASCFLITGGLLIATLAFAKPIDQRFDTLFPTASQIR